MGAIGGRRGAIGMMSLGEDQIERFHGIVRQRLGVKIETTQLAHAAETIQERSRVLGCRAKEYLDLLERAPATSAEFEHLADALSVPETHFFRHSGQLDALTHAAVPDLLQDRPAGMPLRILSAGCASGEELYSIAILLREAHGLALARCGAELLGIDASPRLVKRARTGVYTEWSLRGTDETRRRRYFVQNGRTFELVPEIRNMARFEPRNLVAADGGFWQAGRFDVVFFRNVAIYMPLEVQKNVIARIARSLIPKGYLFLGPSETLRGVSQDFHLQHSHESFYYRKVGEGESRPLITPISPRVSQSAPEVEESPRAGDSDWVDQIGAAAERISRIRGEPATPRQPVPGGKKSEMPEPDDLARAHQLLAQDRHTEALAVLAGLSPSSQADPDAMIARAVALTNSGQIDLARVLCDSLLKIDELNASAHYLMALACEHKGDLGEAVEHDSTAIYLDPSFPMAHLHAGLLARKRGNVVEARRRFASALELLAEEETARLLLFGGGFTREGLIQLARNELRHLEGRR